MATKPDDNVGSGIDKPDPKSLLEKLGDRVKAVMPEKPDEKPTGNGTAQPISK